MNRPVQDLARETAHSIKTLNRELRALQAEYDQAPTLSFSKRMKAQIAEEIVRLERRKAGYVKTLNELNQQQRVNARPALRPSTKPLQRASGSVSSGWHKVQQQQRIDTLYQQIGALGARISTMAYTPERKQLIEQHKALIRQRRQLIWEVNQASQPRP